MTIQKTLKQFLAEKRDVSIELLKKEQKQNKDPDHLKRVHTDMLLEDCLYKSRVAIINTYEQTSDTQDKLYPREEIPSILQQYQISTSRPAYSAQLIEENKAFYEQQMISAATDDLKSLVFQQSAQYSDSPLSPAILSLHQQSILQLLTLLDFKTAKVHFENFITEIPENAKNNIWDFPTNDRNYVSKNSLDWERSYCYFYEALTHEIANKPSISINP